MPEDTINNNLEEEKSVHIVTKKDIILQKQVLGVVNNFIVLNKPMRYNAKTPDKQFVYKNTKLNKSYHLILNRKNSKSLLQILPNYVQSKDPKLGKEIW